MERIGGYRHIIGKFYRPWREGFEVGSVAERWLDRETRPFI